MKQKSATEINHRLMRLKPFKSLLKANQSGRSLHRYIVGVWLFFDDLPCRANAFVGSELRSQLTIAPTRRCAAPAQESLRVQGQLQTRQALLSAALCSR